MTTNPYCDLYFAWLRGIEKAVARGGYPRPPELQETEEKCLVLLAKKMDDWETFPREYLRVRADAERFIAARRIIEESAAGSSGERPTP